MGIIGRLPRVVPSPGAHFHGYDIPPRVSYPIHPILDIIGLSQSISDSYFMFHMVREP